MGGWQAAGILTLRTGIPLTPLLNADISNTGTTNPTGAASKIGKDFCFHEGKRIQFRCEMFNFSNTPHFDLPGANVDLPTAARITSAGAPRQIQFGLKFVF